MQFGMYAPVPHVTVGSKEITRSVKGALGPLPAGEIDPGFTLAKDVLVAADESGFDLCLYAERHLGADFEAWILAAAVSSWTHRLRAMPAPVSSVLGAKLLARFLVGVVQMVLLFAVGRLLFGISLGREPWLLILPTAAIVFAGTTFGLVVAALATSREAVLPIGSIAIVTMAAVGGCWWPIDLEPRWMRQAALAFPTTWAMEAFNDLMIRRRGLEAAVRPTIVMLAFGLLYLVVGTLLFRRRLLR